MCLCGVGRPAIALLACLVFFGCATQEAPPPFNWRSADGRSIDNGRLQGDIAVCKAQALSAAARMGARQDAMAAYAQAVDFSALGDIGDTLRRNGERRRFHQNQEQLARAVMEACMAERGYLSG